jgi:hypothetical protein
MKGNGMLRKICLLMLLSVPIAAQAQVSPYRVLGSEDAKKYDSAPHAFLGCCHGAWWLNGNDGIVLHEHSGLVEHWAMVQDNSTPDWYYYHEKSLDGSVDFPDFKWRFYRYYNPSDPTVGVERKYPSDSSWTHVCNACLTILPANAIATKESRKSSTSDQ